MNFAIPAAFEEIETMVRYFEHAVVIAAGLIALAWIACEWRGA